MAGKSIQRLTVQEIFDVLYDDANELSLESLKNKGACR